MGRAIFELVNGTDKVNMLSKRSGICLSRWNPSRTQMKGGGIFTESPLSDGRNLSDYYWSNWTESLTFAVRAGSQDVLIEQYARKLDAILIKGLNYWARPNAQTTPTYIKAKGKNETNPRYAIIKGVTFPSDNFPYATPFFGAFCKSAMSDVELQIEHAGWMTSPPGETTCVQISGNFPYGTDTLEFTPAASADDCDVTNSTTSIDTSQTYMTINDDMDAGVRFTSVTIPQGATILSATITLVATLTKSGSITIDLEGEDVDDSATFSTYANFTGRARTSASVAWSVPNVSAGVSYDTPDISDVVQEIIDRPGWSSGNDLSIFMMYDSGGVGVERVWRTIDYATGILAAILTITYRDGSLKGQEATCDPQVYVSNRQTRAPLTHIFNYDSSLTSFSANLIDSTSFTIFPVAGVANGDIIYFGCDYGASNNEGPFSSLVFDLGTAMAGTYTITWEYSTGAGWSALTVQDNTSDFTLLGVSSVHWTPIAGTTWTTRAVNGATALWVRARISAFTSASSQAITQNREVYTINWPKVNVDSAQLGGDMRALIECLNIGVSGDDLTLDATGFLVASRLTSRGSDFQAYINANDNHNPTGVGIAGGGVAATNNTAPGGIIRPSGTPTSDPEKMLYVRIQDSIASQYKGDFAVVMRTIGAFQGFMSMSLDETPDVELVTLNTVVTPPASGDLTYSFLGRITLPGVPVRVNIWSINLSTFTVADIIFIPADEFMAHIYYASRDATTFPISETATTPARLTWGNADTLLINQWVIAQLKQNVNLRLMNDYVVEANSLASLLPAASQDLYFFFTQDGESSSVYNADNIHDGEIYLKTSTTSGGNATDDASINDAAATINLAANPEDFGSAGAFGVVFRNPAVPADRIQQLDDNIISAKITFIAAATATPGDIFIQGFDQDTVATFSTYPDFVGRPVTDAFVNWTSRKWINGSSYETAELRSIVQEIVARNGWVPATSWMGFVFKDGANTQTFSTFDGALTNISITVVHRTFDNINLTTAFGPDGRYGTTFPTVTIPKGARIDSAYMTFKAAATTTDIADVLITGEDDGNASAAGYVTYADLESRVRTSAAVVWSPTAWVSGTLYNTADISDIVREIIANDNWTSGNAMSFILNGGTTAQIFHTVNAVAAADRPELTINYTTPQNDCRQAISNILSLQKNQRYTSMRGST